MILNMMFLNKAQTTGRNYVNGRVLRHVTQLHFGTAGGKNDIKTNLKRFAVFIGFHLTHYIL